MHSVFNRSNEVIETLRDYIDRKLTIYDSPKYTYMVINKKNPGDIFIVTSYPNEWAELYTNNNYQNIDPVVLIAFRRFSPFSWDENMLLIETHEKMLTLSQRNMNIQERQGKGMPGKAILSPRENEVLYWASMGKTYQEIAIITNITPRTVKYHIGNVVKKLGVINAKQAIGLGVELEIIKPILA